MNADVKAAWVKALRSGEYKQGKDVLRNPKDDTYCCLGVLCELAVADGVVTREDKESFSVYAASDDDYSMAIPPEAVRIWAGMEYHNPRLGVDKDGDPVMASWQNDHMNADFNRIADLIEEHL